MQHSIASIYTQQMVPLGQMVELLRQLVNASTRNTRRQVTVRGRAELLTARACATALTGQILDTLHLVNVALQSRIVCEVVPVFSYTQLVTELDDLIDLMHAVLRDWANICMKDPKLDSAMHSVLIHPRIKASLDCEASFTTAMGNRIEQVSRSLAHIWAEIDYLPKDRNTFLRTRLQSAKNMPLVRGMKAGYWHTLVRNTPLAHTLALLDVSLNKTFLDSATLEGRSRVLQLLETLPGYRSLRNREKLVGPTTTRIPAEVSLVVKDGLFELTQVVPCRIAAAANTDPSGWAEFLHRHGLTMPAADDRTLQVTCGVETLARALQHMEQTAASMLKDDQAIIAAFEKEQTESRQASLVEKLTATFNEEEMQALAAYFTQKA